jgi:hypothetical protein
MRLIASKTGTYLPWALLVGLLVFQAWGFYFRLPLSLGPRVILQPWLMQRGFLIYENIGDLHSPLMPMALSAMLPVISDPLRLAKLVLVGLLCLSTILAFLIASRRCGSRTGLGAALFLVLWAPVFEAGKLWHESFLTPLYLLLYLVDDLAESKRATGWIVLLGVIGGIAILIKQHAVIVFGVLLLWNAYKGWLRWRSAGIVLKQAFLMGSSALAVILAFLVFQFLKAGTLEGVYYWIISYQASGIYRALATQPLTMKYGIILAGCALLLPAAAACLIDAKRRTSSDWLFMAGGLLLLAASSITAFPRFELFHLQPALALLAVATACTGGYMLRSQPNARSFILAMLGALAAFWLLNAGERWKPAFQAGNSPRLIREYSDMEILAGEIRRKIGPDEGVYLFHDDEVTANLYYLLNCLPPRYWVFQYPWYMVDPLKGRMLAELKKAAPAWVVCFPDHWRVDPLAPEIAQYVQHHYRQTAVLPKGALLLSREK